MHHVNFSFSAEILSFGEMHLAGLYAKFFKESIKRQTIDEWPPLIHK